MDGWPCILSSFPATKQSLIYLNTPTPLHSLPPNHPTNQPTNQHIHQHAFPGHHRCFRCLARPYRRPGSVRRPPVRRMSLSLMTARSINILDHYTDLQLQLPCLIKAVPSSGCTATDVKCQCTTGQAKLAESLQGCIPSACSADDAASMLTNVD